MEYKNENTGLTAPVKSLVTLPLCTSLKWTLVTTRKSHIPALIYTGDDHLPYSFTDYFWEGRRGYASKKC